MMGERYFVRAKADGPEKGPYEVAAIKSSFDNGMLKGDATVRGETSGSTLTLRELLEIPSPRERIRSEAAREYASQDLDRNVMQHGTDGSTNVMIGVGMIVAGLGLTAATYSAASGGGRYVVFSGLIVFGFVRIIRGAR